MSPTKAQVFEANNLQAQDVIVRDIDGTHSIIYGYDPQAQMGFFALDSGKNDFAYFYLTNKMLVRDVEVEGKYVLFCGSMSGVGAIGYFVWEDVFSGTDDVTYIPCWPPYVNQQGYYVEVKEFTKMDWFYDNGVMNFALIGDAVIDQYLFLSRTVITSAWNAGSSMWGFQHFYNKDGEITYTDIAALDDAVVAVGNRSNKGCYWKPFKQGIGFTAMPFHTTWVTRVDYTSAIGPALIVRTGHNRAAAVHHNEMASTTVHRLEQNTSTGLPAAYDHSYYVDPVSPQGYNNKWHLYDLRFNHSLYLLEDADHEASGAYKRWVLDLPESSSPPAFNAQILSVGDQMSMSINGTSYWPYTSGNTGSRLSIYRPVDMTLSTSCNQNKTLTPQYGDPIIFEEHTSHDEPLYHYPVRTFQPIILHDGYTEICH